MKTPEQIEKLNAKLKSGDALNLEQLAWHCVVNPKKAPACAKASGLQPDVGNRYPWRRIWRHIHGTEGSHLARHLADLKEQYPDSEILSEIDDLEAALRVPLIDFTTMAERLGEKPDTLAKAVRQGRATLPFPTIKLGPRKRHYRPLAVRPWVDEEIRLDLPEPSAWATISASAAETSTPDTNEAATSIDPSEDEASTPVEPVKKALFGAFAADSRKNPT